MPPEKRQDGVWVWITTTSASHMDGRKSDQFVMILCPNLTLKGSWKQAETFFCVPMLGLDLHSSLPAQIACGSASEMVIMAGPGRCSALG